MFRANNPNAPQYYGGGYNDMNFDGATRVSYRRNPGYFERVGSSFCGIGVGFVILILSFPLLFYNEGRAVQTAKSLDEGLGIVNTLSPANQMFGSYEGKLVHISDKLKSSKSMHDAEFAVDLHCVALKRKVEMFQWIEHENTREYNEGDRTRVETSYSYTKEWRSEVINSGGFSQSTIHRNPGHVAIEGYIKRNFPVHVAEFQLSEGLINKVYNFKKFIPSMVPYPFKIVGEYIYKSSDPYSPQIGDLRITFEYAGKSDPNDRSKQDTVSIIAKQSGAILTSYQTKAGDALEILYDGEMSPQEIFASEHSSNTKLTWVLRFVGWLLMFIGFQIIMDIFRQIVSFLPIIRDIVSLATSIVAFTMATSLSLTTISIAWFWYRPFLSLAIIIGAAVPIYLSRKKAAEEKSAQERDR